MLSIDRHRSVPGYSIRSKGETKFVALVALVAIVAIVAIVALVSDLVHIIHQFLVKPGLHVYSGDFQVGVAIKKLRQVALSPVQLLLTAQLVE